MSKPLIVHTLTEKRAEILGQIKAYEAQIAHAKHDLAHVNATIELFAAPERQRARYIVSHGFFKKGEIADICVRHLGADAELTTRELAERVMAERNLDISDTALRNSVVFKVVQALRHAKRRKLVRMVEKKKGMCVWGCRRRRHAARRCQYPFHDRLTGDASAPPIKQSARRPLLSSR